MMVLKFLGGLALIAVIFIGVGMVFTGATMTPEMSQWYDDKRRLERFCEQDIADSAPGGERRGNRAMCENLMRIHQEKKPAR